MVKVEVIKNGKIVEVSAMSDLEKFKFAKLGKNEELECRENYPLARSLGRDKDIKGMRNA